MKQHRHLLATAITTGTLGLIACSAHADSFTWNFTSGTNTISGSGVGNTGSATTTLGGITVNYSGWANTGTSTSGSTTDGVAGALYDAQRLVSWGDYNLGMYTMSNSASCSGTVELARSGCSSPTSSNTGSPNHAMDNNDAHEFVLFEFNEAVALNKVAIGWPDTAGTQDMTIIAYKGPGAMPSMYTLSSSSILTGAANDLFYIEHLPTVSNDYQTPQQYGTISNFNVGNITSKYWIVGAYNPLLNTGSTAGLDGGNDYFKLAMLGGNYTPPLPPPPPPPTSTPEPETFMLLSATLAGLSMTRRRRTNKDA